MVVAGQRNWRRAMQHAARKRRLSMFGDDLFRTHAFVGASTTAVATIDTDVSFPVRTKPITFRAKIQITANGGVHRGLVFEFGDAASGAALWIGDETIGFHAGPTGTTNGATALYDLGAELPVGLVLDLMAAVNPGNGEVRLWANGKELARGATAGGGAFSPLEWSGSGDGSFASNEAGTAVTDVPAASSQAPAGFIVISPLSVYLGQVPRSFSPNIAAEAEPPEASFVLSDEGVVPFTVHCDAIDVTAGSSGVLQPASGNIGDLYYFWSFGDSGDGVYNLNGTSKSSNFAVGPEAAHTYQVAGPFTITLTIIELDGTLHTYTKEITALDPEVVYAASTFYVDSEFGDDVAGDGTEATPWATADKAFEELFADNGPRRVLLRCFNEQEYPLTTQVAPANLTGPFHLGVYDINPGEGLFPPNILSTVAGDSATSAIDIPITVSGVHLENFKLTKMSGAGRGVTLGVDSVCHNLRVNNFDRAYHLDGALRHRNSFSRCSANNGAFYGWYIGADGTTPIEHIALIGCSSNGLSQAAGAHVRSFARRSTIQGGFWQGYAGGGPAIRILGTLPSGSAYVCFTDNRTTTNTAAPVEIGPENDQNQLVDNVLHEGNWYSSSGTSVQTFVELMGQRITSRNNQYVSTNNWVAALRVRPKGGSSPVPSGIRIHHETLYCATNPAGAHYLCSIDAAVTDPVDIANCIAWGPLRTFTLVEGTGAFTDTTNLLTDPTFTNPATNVFTLQAGSAALNVGTAKGAWRDYARLERPFGAGHDIGAHERQS